MIETIKAKTIGREMIGLISALAVSDSSYDQELQDLVEEDLDIEDFVEKFLEITDERLIGSELHFTFDAIRRALRDTFEDRRRNPNDPTQ